jgi:lysozyme
MSGNASPRFNRQSSLALAALATFSLLAAGCDNGGVDDEPAASQTSNLTQCARGETTEGIDVSRYQGDIDWPQVKAGGKQFAFIRVAAGTKRDVLFDKNWTGAKAAGVLRGVYVYFKPSADAAEQANILVDAVGRLGADDLPAVADVEDPSASLEENRAGLETFLRIVEEGTGKKPLLYTSPGYADRVGGGFEAYPLWLAHYTSDCPRLPTQLGHSHWTFWQNVGDAGESPGVNGPCDNDLFNGTLEELRAFARNSSTTPETPEPSPQPGPSPQPDPTPRPDPVSRPTTDVPAGMCYSDTLMRAVSKESCVQASSDQKWYICNGDTRDDWNDATGEFDPNCKRIER